MSHDSHHSDLGHILPFKTYATVFSLLILLTFVTVAVAKIPYFNLGNPNANLIFAMVIASIKALMVALFFMHLKYENPVTWLYAAFPIILLFFLIGGLFIDNPTRVHGRDGGPAFIPTHVSETAAGAEAHH